jgi:hypothetical protein
MSAAFTTMTYDPNQQVRGSTVYQGQARPAVNEFHMSSGLQSQIHQTTTQRLKASQQPSYSVAGSEYKPARTTRVVRASDDISVYQNEYSASIESRELKPTHWSGGVFSSEAHRLTDQEVLSPKSQQIRKLEAEFTKGDISQVGGQPNARNGLSGAASNASGDHYLRSFCFPDYMRAQAADSAGEVVSPRSRHFLDTTSAEDWANRGQPAAADGAFWEDAPNANAAPAPAQSYTTRPVSELPFNYSLDKQASDAGNPVSASISAENPKLPAPAPSQFSYSDYVKAKNISDAGGLVSPRSQHYLSTTTAADWTTRYVHQRDRADPAAMSPAQEHSYHDLAKSRNSFR